MDDKYRELEAKYKKKCERVSQLIKKNKYLEDRVERLCNRDDWAWQHVKKFNVLEDALGKAYYKVFYSALTKGAGIMKFDETIFCCHPRIAILEIEKKGYTQFEFLSVEKLA